MGWARADAQHVEIVDIRDEAERYGAMRVAWPTWHVSGGESGGGESAADDELINDAGRGGARADAGRVAGRVARWATTTNSTATIIGATDTTTDFTNRANATHQPTIKLCMQLTMSEHYVI